MTELLTTPAPAPAPIQLPPGAAATAGALVAWVARLEHGRRNAGLFWAACRALERAASDVDLQQLVGAGVAAGTIDGESGGPTRSDATEVRIEMTAAMPAVDSAVFQSAVSRPAPPVTRTAARAWAKVLTARSADRVQNWRVNTAASSGPAPGP